MNIIQKWRRYKELYSSQNLSQHSKAPLIRHHLRHLEHYLPKSRDPRIGKGRRHEIDLHVMSHQDGLKKCGITPPGSGVEASNMLDDFSIENYV